MADHMTKPLAELEKEILEDGVVDAKEAAMLRERLFADGRIDREEADFMFRLNDAVSGKANDPAWQQLFVHALTTHVLSDEKSPGVVDDDEAAYLESKIQADGKVDDAEQALLVNIIRKAKSTTPDFQKFVLASMKTAILADGVIDEAEVQQIRTIVYGSGSGGGAAIDRPEAEFLFELNNATSGKPNHASWKELFVEAIAKHVLEDEISPGQIDDDEAAWLVRQIEGDGTVDDNEKALLMEIKEKAKSIAGALKEWMTALGL
jgi:uncharacterized membrane protein YebE (DUF533 family)